MAPACLILPTKLIGSVTKSSKCSGAIILITSAAISRFGKMNIYPFFLSASSAMALRGKVGSCLFISSETSFACVSDIVTKMGIAISSCSAWESRSAATHEGGVVPSEIMAISLGPAIISMPTCPNTSFLAAAT